jgi:hypothetical protein
VREDGPGSWLPDDLYEEEKENEAGHTIVSPRSWQPEDYRRGQGE